MAIRLQQVCSIIILVLKYLDPENAPERQKSLQIEKAVLKGNAMLQLIGCKLKGQCTTRHIGHNSLPTP